MNRRMRSIVIAFVLIIVLVGGLVFFKLSDRSVVLAEKKMPEQTKKFPLPTKAFPEVDGLDQVAVKKDIDHSPIITAKSNLEEKLLVAKKNEHKLSQIYKTPYFTIKYLTKEWQCAEGKSMDIPSYIDIPKNISVSTVQFIDNNNENSIFLNISSAEGADFSKMSDQVITEYLQDVYDDYRIMDVPIKTINDNKFAVFEFSPQNNSEVLVMQYLTTKSNYLYSISFIEIKSNPINKKMVDVVLNSIKLK